MDDDDDRDAIEEILPTPREALRLLPVYLAVMALILVPLWLQARAQPPVASEVTQPAPQSAHRAP